jgi:putative ABC transport system substrate-binding protein
LLEVAQKRVQLLQELLPDLKILAALSNTNHPGERSEHDATKAAAGALSIDLAYVPFGSAPELEHALEHVRASGAGAMLVFPDGVTMVNRAKIAEFARTHRLPSMFGWREYCEAGDLRATARTSARRMSGWPLTPIGSCCAERTPENCPSSSRLSSNS